MKKYFEILSSPFHFYPLSFIPPNCRLNPSRLYPPITCQAVLLPSLFQLFPLIPISRKNSLGLKRCLSIPITDTISPVEFLQHCFAQKFSICSSMFHQVIRFIFVFQIIIDPLILSKCLTLYLYK